MDRIISKINNKQIIDRLLLFYLVATSGIMYFYKDIEYMVIGLIISGLLFYHRKLKIDLLFLFFYLFVFLIVQLFQATTVQKLPLSTYAGLYARLLFAYFVIKLLGIRFFTEYVRLIYTFALISLFFFTFSIIIPGFEYFFVTKITPFFDNNPFGNAESQYSIVVYKFVNYAYYAFARNSGPFWEPGAFGGFLIIAFLFNLIRTNHIRTKTNVVLIITILTTFSTTAYIGLSLSFIFYFFSLKNIRYKIFFVPLVIILSIFAYIQFDFMDKKISKNLSSTTMSMYTKNTRFKSALLDLKSFSMNPLIGAGRSSEYRFSGAVSSFTAHRNNGTTYLLGTYGIIVFLLYFFLMHKSIKKYCIYNNINPIFSIYFVLIVLMLGFSESYFTRVFFYSLTFLHLVIPKKKSLNAKK
jgi:hypothetical protein